MVRIDVSDAGRAKDLVRVLVTHVGAEPVSLDPHTGAVWVTQTSEAELAVTLGAVDAWLEDADVAVISFSGGVRTFTITGSAAAGQGLEPQLPDPESGVLPLDDPATGRRPV